MPEEQLFGVFFVVWVILGVGSFAFYWSVRDAALKRRVHPWIMWGAGALFAGFVLLIMGSRAWWVVPIVALMSWLNTRLLQFCDACGRTIYPMGGWSRSDYCPKCGAELGVEKPMSVSRRLSEEARRGRPESH